MVNLVLAAGGVLLLAVAIPELSGARPVGLFLPVLYTGFAVVITVVLAVAVAVTGRMPTLRQGTVDGSPALGVSSWAAPWIHALALDAGLAVLGLALTVAGIAAGSEWAVVSLVPGAIGLWFGVRVGLTAAGRRRRPAMWLTETHVVVDSPAGRARSPRSDVRRVRPRGRRVVVELERDADWLCAPRPWRRAGGPRDTLVLDCSETGHRAADLATWLTEELVAPVTSSARRGLTERRRGTTG
ncbi:hypothetical protein GCM10009797_30470 [Nocardioides hwasunensis]